MPKVRASQTAKIMRFVRDYPHEFACSPSNELYCRLCEVVIKCDKLFFDSHRKSTKHATKIPCASSSSTKQTFLAKNITEDVTKAFLAADIPLHKLEHPAIRSLFFLMGQTPPAESSCRQYVPKLANLEKERLRNYVAHENAFLVVDESDINGQKYVNVLVGVLKTPDKTFLHSVVHLGGNINNQRVCQIVDDTLRDLSIERNNFLLLITDAARYMMLAGRILKSLYSKLFHVTCVAHLLHNAAMIVRSHFSTVDNLVACVKAATLKSGERQLCFSDIGLPPRPVITRWGTWLTAAFWYADNLPSVRDKVRSFEDDGVIVSRAKDAIEGQDLASQLTSIQSYRSLVHLIEKSESANYCISTAIREVRELDFGPDPCGIKSYLEKRITKSDFPEILECKREDISPSEYFQIQNAQATSASVERSFSMLKNILRKNRNFSPENVANYAIVNFNNSV
jgi:hypothetical protein